MREIGVMMIPETGIEAFELACRKAKRVYGVERAISGYWRLFCDGTVIHDDPTCEDVHDDDKAYWFFAELVSEKEKS